MSFILILIFLMAGSDALFWIWANRIMQRRGNPRIGRWLLNGFMAVQLASLLFVIFGRFFSERTDELIPRFLLSAVFLWHFIFVPIAIIVALLEVTSRRLAAKRSKPQPIEMAAVESSPNRREFLRTLAVAAPPLATILTTGFALAQQEQFRTRTMEIALKQLPRELDGLTIAHVTDIHVGRFTEGAVLRKIIQTTNNLHADLVLLTGDLINHALADLPAGLDAVRKMDARYGIYMCEGNHDLLEDRAAFEQTVRRSGIPLLINENKVLNIRGTDMQLLGLRWGSAGGAKSINIPQRGDAAIADSMNVLLPQIQPSAFPILLAHHPHAFDLAANAGIPLTLSGHTHGGQIMASQNLGFGPLMFRYWSGLYEKAASKMVVSNGTGNWFPLRINAPAEIVHITLRRDNS